MALIERKTAIKDMEKSNLNFFLSYNDPILRDNSLIKNRKIILVSAYPPVNRHGGITALRFIQ